MPNLTAQQLRRSGWTLAFREDEDMVIKDQQGKVHYKGPLVRCFAAKGDREHVGIATVLGRDGRRAAVRSLAQAPDWSGA